jgi:glycosyltransferase involved in cell wall biosynthesis
MEKRGYSIGLIYAHALGDGGYPRDIRWLASALVARGVEVTLFCHVNEKERFTEGLVQEVHIEPIENVGKKGVDLYHVFGILILRHIWIIRKLLDRPIVISPMGHLMPHHLRRKALKKALYLQVVKSVLRRARWFHAFSDVESYSITQYLGDGVEIFKAGLGVFRAPSEAAQRRNRKINKESNQVRLLFFGRNDVYQKGIDILLEGYAKAIHAGAIAMLTIAGKPWRESERYIRDFIERQELGTLVQVLGPVEEAVKWKLLVEVDYLVFLSRWDGPPRPIREAIAVGTPVIVSSETNMGHLVTEFGAGLEVPLNPDEVAKAILRASKEKALWHKHREGVKKLYERLSWDRVAEDYIRGYQRVLESLS